MTGTFTGYLAYIPPGAAFPTGTEIDRVADAKSFEILAWALSQQQRRISAPWALLQA